MQYIYIFSFNLKKELYARVRRNSTNSQKNTPRSKPIPLNDHACEDQRILADVGIQELDFVVFFWSVTAKLALIDGCWIALT